MAQDMANSGPVAEGGIVRAWVDVALHPRFETFQRWFPLMKTRWRLISLVATLILIGIEGLVIVLTFPAYSRHTIQALTLHNVAAYAFSPGGKYKFAYFAAGAVAALYAMPAAVALISARSLGPYTIRFKRVFRPWIQAQPAICMLIIAGWVIDIPFLPNHASASTPLYWVVTFVELLLLTQTFMRAWVVSYKALSAGSSRSQFLAGLAAAIPGLLIWLLPALLGHPVL